MSFEVRYTRGVQRNEFQVGDRVLLKVSPWKCVIRFRKRGKLGPRYIGPFTILARVGKVAYRLELPAVLGQIHNTFHVSQLRKCLADETAHIPLGDIQIDESLNYVERPVAVLDRKGLAVIGGGGVTAAAVEGMTDGGSDGCCCCCQICFLADDSLELLLLWFSGDRWWWWFVPPLLLSTVVVSGDRRWWWFVPPLLLSAVVIPVVVVIHHRCCCCDNGVYQCCCRRGDRPAAAVVTVAARIR
ncbi:hypothetical protein OSB04_003449 [Centaurea solstitialis]|uniref:Tf2-1-like SH3-like domain-containing protein n=1 Tax=Centaurea solstitialis TaxID=347529 RepID=A0AA38U2C8_9ASTR|nr:hypothetical protein OSB04_003449 [Centaurea solstitialis]